MNRKSKIISIESTLCDSCAAFCCDTLVDYLRNLDVVVAVKHFDAVITTLLCKKYMEHIKTIVDDESPFDNAELPFSEKLFLHHVFTKLKCSDRNYKSKDTVFCELFKSGLRFMAECIVDSLEEEKELGKEQKNASVIICPNYIDFFKLDSDELNKKGENLSEELIGIIEENNVCPDFTIVEDVGPFLTNKTPTPVFTASFPFDKSYFDFIKENKAMLRFLVEKNDQYLNYFKNKGENCFIATSNKDIDTIFATIIKKIVDENINCK